MQSTVSKTDSIADTRHLEDLLSEPSEGVIATLAQLDGDILILGVNGKMGPTLARMARRASDAAGSRRRIIGVSRFSSGNLETELRDHGITANYIRKLHDMGMKNLKADQIVHLRDGD